MAWDTMYDREKQLGEEHHSTVLLVGDHLLFHGVEGVHGSSLDYLDYLKVLSDSDPGSRQHNGIVGTNLPVI